MGLRIQCIDFGARDPQTIATFWEHARGWHRTYDHADEVVLEPPPGSPENLPDILFLRIPEGKSVTNRLHLDFDRTTTRLRSPGSRVLALPGWTSIKPEKSPGW
ncbi:MAG: VOC family protein [Acidimicrobiia bacterium]